jgi:hypothetical protein
MKHFWYLFFIVISFIACQRNGAPDVRICSGKDSYKTTDTLKMLNCSLRSQKQRWVLPDGTKSNDNTVYYVPTGAGNYEFTLYVSDDDFVNEYSTSYTAIVK